MAVLGNNIVVLVQNGQNWEAIAATKSDRIQVNGEMIEINDPDSGQWRKFLMGKLSWVVNVGWLVTQVADLRKVLLVGTRIKIHIGERTWAAGTGLEGYAWVQQCECGATEGSLSQGTFVFQGDGALT